MSTPKVQVTIAVTLDYDAVATSRFTETTDRGPRPIVATFRDTLDAALEQLTAEVERREAADQREAARREAEAKVKVKVPDGLPF